MNNDQICAVIDYCRSQPKENEWCEFKKDFHSPEEIAKDISALANSATIYNRPQAYLVFGIEDVTHHTIGTNFKPDWKGKWAEDLIPWLMRCLNGVADFQFYEVQYHGVRLVVCVIESAKTKPIAFSGSPYIRVESYTKLLVDFPELEKRLWNSLLQSSFESEIAAKWVERADILRLIDWKGYCELMGYAPVMEDAAIEKLEQDWLISFHDGLFDIRNVCAILFAHDLSAFWLKSHAPRVITYRGINKLHAIADDKGLKGYAVWFKGLMSHIKWHIPRIETIWGSTRETGGTYPDVALREFVANAIIHQDFRSRWTEPLIEIFDDRIEISNPWSPLIETNRFLDHPPKSRNEEIADVMRRAKICERRWSGVDRALSAIEETKLPAVKIETGKDFTRVVLFKNRAIGKLTNQEKADAIFQHCALRYVLQQEPLTNTSVCERFGIEEQNSATASRLIKITKETGLIKPFDPSSKTRKHAKYIPYWAT